MSLTEDVAGSLESPTMVSANGGTPVMAIVEDLSLKECRLRAVAAFAAGDRVAFDFTAHGVSKAPVRGHVTAHSENGARRTYTIAIDASDSRAMDQLAIAVDAARRHAAIKLGHEVPTENGLTRAHVRVTANFELTYRAGEGPSRSARATNVSVGGMLMNCSDHIPVGATVELHFALPGEATPITATARIVAHQEASPNYNCAFFSLSEAAKIEIAHFVSATLRQ